MQLTKRQYLILRILYKQCKNNQGLERSLTKKQIIKKSYGFLGIGKLQKQIDYLQDEKELICELVINGNYVIAYEGIQYVESILIKGKL